MTDKVIAALRWIERNDFEFVAGVYIITLVVCVIYAIKIYLSERSEG